MKTQQTDATSGTTTDEGLVLAVFVDFAEEGDAELCRYLLHCGITPEDVERCGDAKSAILDYYRMGNTKTYDLAAVAHDLSRWPPVAAHVRELKAEQREKRAAEERERYRKRKSAH